MKQKRLIMTRIRLSMTNKVVIVPDNDFTHIGEWVLSANQEVMPHVAVVGKVVLTPDKLVCDYERYFELNNRRNISETELMEIQDMNKRSLEWMPHNELKTGDRVMFRYMTQANKQERYFDKAIFMNYTDIFCTLDSNNIPTMINGFILINPTSNTEGVVKYASKHKNKGYLTDRITHDTDVEVGDKVIFQKGFYRPINHELHPILPTDEILWAIQGNRIISKINGK